MSDWLDDATPDEREAFDRYASHFRDEVAGKIEDSSVFISLCPLDGKPDIQFSLELGYAIMIDKPIVVVIAPGTPVPEKLRLVADEIVDADVRTEHGMKRLTLALARMASRAEG